jgi:excisionase family DNA binding protein
MDGLHLDDIFVFPDDQDFRVHHAVSEERNSLEELVRVLSSPDADSGYAELRLTSAQPGVHLPRPVLEVLAVAAAMLLRGDHIEVKTAGGKLSVDEAAAILHCSSSEIEDLIENGEIPHAEVSSVRVALDEVIRFGRQEKARRHAALAEFHRLERELGLDQQD